MHEKVMVSPLSGRWFPAGTESLRRMIAGLMPVPRPAPVAGVCAVLVPHAGYPYSGKVACEVYARLDPQAYDRVVVLGPSHSACLPGEISIPEATALETPLGRILVDAAMVAALRNSPLVVCEPMAHAREHSEQIQVPLLQSVFDARVPVVTIVVGQMDPAASRRVADLLRPWLDARTLLVVSSDFTHFGPNFEYQPFTTDIPAQLKALDHRVFAAIAAGDPEAFRVVMQETRATVCGHDPIAVLLELLPPGARATEVAYDTSGRQLDDWQNSVSYLGALFVGDWRQSRGRAEPPDTLLDAADRTNLLKLARATLEYAARHGKAPDVRETGVTLTPGMQQVMGGFVTLNKHEELRGCIGEIVPRRAIWQVVLEHAVNAALHDPRFERVTPDETRAIRIDISALTPPQPVASYREIVIGKHGMTLAKHGRSAVFLPQVAPEQGWDRDTTLSHLARKAGLPADAWREGATFTVFEAQVFHEE
jgi:AmmeMemoRadiSam system protein B/AmmeMemoRadiSam system protein A